MYSIPTSVCLAMVALVVLLVLPAAAGKEKPGATAEAPDTQGKVVSRSFFGGVEYQKQQQLSGPLPAGGRLVSEIRNGSITVTGRAEDGCDVAATITAKASSEKRAAELAHQVKIALIPQGDQVRVDVQEPTTSGRESLSVDLDIRVPRRTSADSHTKNGRIRLDGLEGNAVCRTANGQIDLKSVAGRVELQTDNGAINAGDLAADSQIRTSTGAVDIRYAKGGPRTCTIRAANGQVTCRNVSGDLKVEADNGAVDVAYAADAPGACRIDITTKNGSIRLVAPKDLSAKVSARTSSGQISTHLPLTVKGGLLNKQIEGTVGSGEGEVHLRTSNGTIDLR